MKHPTDDGPDERPPHAPATAGSGFVPLPDAPFDRTDEHRARPAQPEATPAAAASAPTRSDGAVAAEVCPYCGATLDDPHRCWSCKGRLDPLSRQASQNSMGPWYVLDTARPGMPGCSAETLRGLIARGRITRHSIVRGPSTRQFWVRADHAPGIASLLGVCHACKASVRPDQDTCEACGAPLRLTHDDRQHLGLTEARPLPGDAPAPERAEAPSTPITPATRRELEAMRGTVKRLVFFLVLALVSLVGLGGFFAWQTLSERGYTLKLPNQTETPSNGSSSTAPRASPTPGSNTPARTAPASAPQRASEAGEPSIDHAIFGTDPMLEPWHADLRRAHELERTDDRASLERAIAILERVLQEANAEMDADPARFPVLRDRILRIQERADRFYAEDMLRG